MVRRNKLQALRRPRSGYDADQWRAIDNVIKQLSTSRSKRPTSHAGAETLVLLPSLADNESMSTKLPFSRHFGERSLPDLAVLRNPHQRAVLVTAEPIDPWIIHRVLSDLSSGDAAVARGMRARLTCLVPRPHRPGSLADAVLADRAVMHRLRGELGNTTSGRLVNFAASDACDQLGSELGIAVEEGPAPIAAIWGTKAAGKRLFREAGVLCPDGDPQVVRNVAQATRSAWRLANADPAIDRVMVKLDAASWGAGVGNAVARTDVLRRGGDLRQAVERLLQPWESYERELVRGGAIVEEFITGITSSPSAQGFIWPDGRYELLAAHDQILSADEYRGCTFPVQHAVRAPVGRAMALIGPRLAQHGVRGSFGVDFVFARGVTYAVEINLRKSGPSHVIKAVHAVAEVKSGGERDGALELAGAYVHRRLLHPELFTALTPATAVVALERHGLLLQPGSRAGAMLHVLGALRRFGFVETTALAHTAAAANDLDERAASALVEAARSACGIT